MISTCNKTKLNTWTSFKAAVHSVFSVCETAEKTTTVSLFGNIILKQYGLSFSGDWHAKIFRYYMIKRIGYIIILNNSRP